MSGVVCPQCDHDDLIQRVQAVVAGGLTEVKSSGGFGGITYSDGQWGVVGGPTATSGTATTLLAQRLMPPPKPKLDSNKLKQAMLWFVLLLALVLGLNCFSSGSTEGAICIGVPSLLVITVAIYRDSQRRRRAKAELLNRVAAWELAMNRWRRVYYCSRDDIVFDPETSEWCEPADLEKFLYNESRR